MPKVLRLRQADVIAMLTEIGNPAVEYNARQWTILLAIACLSARLGVQQAIDFALRFACSLGDFLDSVHAAHAQRQALRKRFFGGHVVIRRSIAFADQ